MTKTALLLAAALAASLPSTPASAKSVVVTAARMVDVLAGRVVEEPVVLITDGRIVSVVGRGGARPIVPEGATRIDLPGKTILPGLIDMHVHLTSLAEIGGYRGFQYTDSFWSAVGVANAAKTLRAGFTTVRNVGSDGFQDVGLREAVDEGWIPGPRIVTAGYAIGATGGHCDNNMLPPSFDRPENSVVNSPMEGRAKSTARWRGGRRCAGSTNMAPRSSRSAQRAESSRLAIRSAASSSASRR
jgi:imidazolonepropionase-like amidohydrolase